MQLNSFVFLLAFLPASAVVYHAACRTLGRRAAVAWLIAASLFFYGYERPAFSALLAASVVFNYAVGAALARGRGGRTLLIFGVAANLGIIAFFKYFNFFINPGHGFAAVNLLLPAGISFYTLERIAHLVEQSRGRAAAPDFLCFCGAAAFFPRLTAGPIVYHDELMPQMHGSERKGISLQDVSAGLTMFAIGLFKKEILAAAAAPIVDIVFKHAQAGDAVTIFEAWAAAFAFLIQIFFDFSGYTDMALGSARIFGFRLPVNFNRPFAASDIIDFWRRWHITLSRFLRDYVYFPLGGGRPGNARRYLNIMITMLVCGLWHGSGWNFIAWGGLLGLFIIITHTLQRASGSRAPGAGIRARLAALIPFVLVSAATTLVRAEDVTSAAGMFRAMLGFNGISLPPELAGPLRFLGGPVVFHGLTTTGMNLPGALFTLTALYAACRLLPTTQEFLARFEPALGFDPPQAARGVRWAPTWKWALPMAALAAAGLSGLFEVSHFIYFRF